jgi:osmotically inducible lipoprotein OsmB
VIPSKYTEALRKCGAYDAHETKDKSATVRIKISEDIKMIGVVRNKRMLATFLGVALLLGTFGSFNVSAQGRYRRPHHSRAKGALIGGAIGLLGGALIGGGRGALIGAGANAGTGYLVQRHRNQRQYRRYYRRF